MKSTKKVRWVAMLAAVALLLVACGGDGDEASEAAESGEEEPTEVDDEDDGEEDADAAGGDDVVVGVSFPDSTSTLYVEFAAGIEALADEIGVETIIVYAGGDPTQQLDDVDTLLARGVDVMLMSPIDADASIPAYETIQAAGIPVVSIARRTADSSLEDSFVGASWDIYGVEIAEWTCEATGGEGKVAMLKGPAGASFVDEMEIGYKGYIEENCPGLEIVFETNVVPMSDDQALQPTEDALSANPDITVIYSQLDDMVGGVLTVLDEQGRSDDVLVTGFDGTPEAFARLREGSQAMTISLQPFRWGQAGLETAVAFARGGSPGDFVQIDSTLVDTTNIGDFTDEDLR